MRAKLVVSRDGLPVRRAMLYEGQRLELGRGRAVDIRVKGLGVSRRHVAFELSGDGITVEDLGSRNGTSFGERVLEKFSKTPVAEGQCVTVGPYEISVVQLGGAEPHAEAERRSAEELVAEHGIEVRYLVGKGTGGAVWAGWQPSLERMVAIKIMSLAGADEEDRQRFLREAQVVARIVSDHVVQLYDFGIKDGRPFILLELVPGLSVKDRLGEGPLSLFDALEIGEHVAGALVALQTQDVIHRDVKPANILLTADGIAKLTDFGIAKDLASDSELTQKGVGLGTFSYMAPEQLEARLVTPAADVYGLGATLYHLIAGRPPFMFTLGVSVPAMIEMIVAKEAPPLSEFRSDCPGELAQFVERMLAKVPEARPSAAVVETMLRKVRRYHCVRDTRRMIWESSTDTCVDGW